MAPPHFLLVTYPGRGHVTPSLSFARRLIRVTGARVTFATCVSVFNRSMIPKQSSDDDNNNLSFLAFPDGSDPDVQKLLVNLKRNGEETLSNFIEANRNGDSPVDCLLYTILPSWVPRLARKFHIRSVHLWNQPALVFHAYYNHSSIGNSCFELPNFLTLAARDLPSYLLPSNTYKTTQEAYQELIDFLKEESNLKILVNTFDSLEPEALMANPNIEMVAVGPLLPLEIFSRESTTSSIKDLSREKSSYSFWLDSKTESSVIYISFGTMVELSKKQIEELARALIEERRPFLWVITDKSTREGKVEGEEETEIEKIADFRHELQEFGMIVPWCSQIEVLRHRAVGCFVTHCGWSSTLENLVLGVPVVAFPVWADQPTIAKLMDERWKIGMRVREDEEGLVGRKEIRRCLEAVMGQKAEELRKNAAKWKRLAVEAGEEGGSSDRNIEAFIKSLF